MSNVPRILVCGGRKFGGRVGDEALLDEVMRELVGAVRHAVVIHGGALGADTMAGEWAKRAGLTVEVYEAQWHLHGKGAGLRRNARMLHEGKPTLVVAFPGGAGTADMVNRARDAGVPTVRVSKEGFSVAP